MTQQIVEGKGKSPFARSGDERRFSLSPTAGVSAAVRNPASHFSGSACHSSMPRR